MTRFRAIRRFRVLPLLACALVLAGCAHPRGGEPAAGEGPRLPALMQQVGTPDEIARWAVARCAGAGGRQMACYDAVLNAVLGPRGVRPTMETLAAMTALDPAVARDGHVYAHGVGIAAYHGAAEMNRTFMECTPLHQSGCYHGVIQAYFADMQAHGGVTEASTRAACHEMAGDAWLLFQCAHGVGHGLTALYGHDLPRALHGCDLLATEYERSACWGGAFMENVVSVASPHHHDITSALDHVASASSPAEPSVSGAQAEHTGHEGMAGMEGMGSGGHGAHAEPASGAASPASPAGHSEHEGMAGMEGMDHGAHEMAGMDHAAHAGTWKAVDPSDPLYPCTAVGERYQDACYSMQTSVMLHLNGGDVAAAARGCDGAPVRMRAPCYASLGRDINSITGGNHAEAARLCGSGSPEYRPWCHLGVVKNVIDVSSRADDGLPYCASLPDARDKSRCYRAVGEELLYTPGDRAGREATCRKAEPGYEAVCRDGARLDAR